MKRKKIELILLFVIIALGIFMRLWKLDSLPNGLDGDVIITATNSLHLFNDKELSIFQNNKVVGGPVAYLFWSMPLGSLLIATFMNIFNQVEFGALFSSAFVGIITIPLVYIFCKKIIDNNTALLATFFFAVSPFHLVYSRSGFTHITIIVPLIIVAFLLLKKIVDSNNPKHFLLSGVVWGLILFNAYPIAYIVAPVTILYLLWTRKWRLLFSMKFILGVLIAILLFILFSVCFALLNRYPDPFIVLKESYYQWFAVRLNESQLNTTISKNILSGLRMLFVNVVPAYQFGVLRIFNFPIFDYFTSFMFLIGFFASVIRRNNTDKLLVLWVILSFLLTSVINIPQERYLYVLLPTPYIFSAAVIISLIKTISKTEKIKTGSVLACGLLLFTYTYFVSYQKYFVSYASNNANMIHGLGDGDVAEYLIKNIDPHNSLIVSSIQLPGVDLSTNFKYSHSILWNDFIKNIISTSLSYTPSGKSIDEYQTHSIEAVTDGNKDTYWFGKTPAKIEFYPKTNAKISSIISFFSATGPGRASTNYSVEYQDKNTGQWTLLKKEDNPQGVCGSAIRNIDLPASKLRFNFNRTLVSDSLQMFEEILILPETAKNLIVPKGITNIVLVLALNPNFLYYGGYNELAKTMETQSAMLFENLESRLSHTVYGKNGEIIYKIYTIKTEDINL